MVSYGLSAGNQLHSLLFSSVHKPVPFFLEQQFWNIHWPPGGAEFEWDDRCRLTVLVLPPAPLHVVLLLQGQRLWGCQLLQLRRLHPFVIPDRRTGRMLKLNQSVGCDGAKQWDKQGCMHAKVCNDALHTTARHMGVTALVWLHYRLAKDALLSVWQHNKHASPQCSWYYLGTWSAL